jgi:hypothetical protein
VHHGGNAAHRIGPASVIEDIGFDQLEPGDAVGAGLFGHRLADLLGLGHGPQRASDGVAGLQQLDHRPFANEPARAGDEHQPFIGHAKIPPETTAAASRPPHPVCQTARPRGLARQTDLSPRGEVAAA